MPDVSVCIKIIKLTVEASSNTDSSSDPVNVWAATDCSASSSHCSTLCIGITTDYMYQDIIVVSPAMINDLIRKANPLIITNHIHWLICSSGHGPAHYNCLRC